MPFGDFEFSRMAMGMMSSQSTSQPLMDEVLDSIPGAKTYFNDTLVFTADFEGQLAPLQRVYGCSPEYITELNPLKCCFCVHEVVFLGHLVSAQGIWPVMDKLAAIMQLPRPRSVKSADSCERLLGGDGAVQEIYQWLCSAVCAAASYDTPQCANVWTTEAIAYLDALKQALCSAPVLALPDWDLPFILSRVAFDAVLSHENTALNTWRSGDDGRPVTERLQVRF
jgi:hypothetical protein